MLLDDGFAVMKNPANLAKHQANPKVAPVIAKMMSKFAGPKWMVFKVDFCSGSLHPGVITLIFCVILPLQLPLSWWAWTLWLLHYLYVWDIFFPPSRLLIDFREWICFVENSSSCKVLGHDYLMVILPSILKLAHNNLVFICFNDRAIPIVYPIFDLDWRG